MATEDSEVCFPPPPPSFPLSLRDGVYDFFFGFFFGGDWLILYALCVKQSKGRKGDESGN